MDFNNFPENPMPGQKYVDSNDETWICNIDGTQWLKYEQNPDGSINTGLTQYDLNKMVIEQLPSQITNGQLKESKNILKQLIEKYKDKYFMLLCNDIHYYTVLHRIISDENIIKFHNLVIELLQDNGVIQTIDWANESKDAVECWIKNEKGALMFMLFPYDWGVVECE